MPQSGIVGIDKAVHFVMYGVLGFLFGNAMHTPPRTTRIRVIFAACFLVMAIGGLDEWHQTYIQGRSTEFYDWLADSVGGLVGGTLWALTLAGRRETRTTA